MGAWWIALLVAAVAGDERPWEMLDQRSAWKHLATRQTEIGDVLIYHQRLGEQDCVQGRIHTSAATVAILPEPDEVEVKIDAKDLRIDTMRAGGPGGQSVNTTDSAVRIVHIPTGITVQCQDEKSQHKNKAKAMKVLSARILEARQAEQDAELSAQRRAQVGSGDRSERIRTYNFPQNRLTDHRINLTLYQLDRIVAGDLAPVVTPLNDHLMEQLLADQGAGAFSG